jgi:hypothetical protein
LLFQVEPTMATEFEFTDSVQTKHDFRINRVFESITIVDTIYVTFLTRIARNGAELEFDIIHNFFKFTIANLRNTIFAQDVKTIA